MFVDSLEVALDAVEELNEVLAMVEVMG